MEWRRGLSLFAPPLAPIKGNISPAVIAFDHPLRIVGRDPEIVIVAVRYADTVEGTAAIVGSVEASIQHIDCVAAFRIGINPRVEPGALAEVALLVSLRPG